MTNEDKKEVYVWENGRTQGLCYQIITQEKDTFGAGDEVSIRECIAELIAEGYEPFLGQNSSGEEATLSHEYKEFFSKCRENYQIKQKEKK